MIVFRMLLERGSLSHDPKLGTFTVKGSSDKPYVVTLYPKQFCSCPATSLCYHIIAVQLSLGMEISQERKKVNLSLLKRNTRNKAHKKSGRKRPTPGFVIHFHFVVFKKHLEDYDTEPAPDSLAKKKPEQPQDSQEDATDPDTIIQKVYVNIQYIYSSVLTKYSIFINTMYVYNPCRKILQENLVTQVLARKPLHMHVLQKQLLLLEVFMYMYMYVVYPCNFFSIK